MKQLHLTAIVYAVAVLIFKKGDYQMSGDNVMHPKHYQTSSGIETIDVIEAFTEDLDPMEAYDTGNILKYMCRWKKKNGLEDLKKARWYLDHLIDIVGEVKDE